MDLITYLSTSPSCFWPTTCQSSLLPLSPGTFCQVLSTKIASALVSVRSNVMGGGGKMEQPMFTRDYCQILYLYAQLIIVFLHTVRSLLL